MNKIENKYLTRNNNYFNQQILYNLENINKSINEKEIWRNYQSIIIMISILVLNKIDMLPTKLKLSSIYREFKRRKK